MTDQSKLPAKTTVRHDILPVEQPGSLLARGLEAVRTRQKPKPFVSERISQLIATAEQGSQDAKYELGFAYRDGDGVSQDYAQAFAWFMLEWNSAASNGSKTFFSPSSSELMRDLLKTMTPKQISEARSLVRDWRMRHAS